MLTRAQGPEHAIFEAWSLTTTMHGTRACTLASRDILGNFITMRGEDNAGTFDSYKISCRDQRTDPGFGIQEAHRMHLAPTNQELPPARFLHRV